jgi:hypothetical protein
MLFILPLIITHMSNLNVTLGIIYIICIMTYVGSLHTNSEDYFELSSQ